MARILVVDDAARVLELASGILSGAGHEVMLCSGGKHALQTLRRDPVQLLITDIYMPEIDGLELIIDARRIRPMVRILAMDNNKTGAPCMLHVAKYLGACRTLQKPFSKSDLLEAVTALLGKSCAFCRLHPEYGPAPADYSDSGIRPALDDACTLSCSPIERETTR
jgi:two-component system, chemotaxis family, chemotaxis protein CheY